MRIRRRVRRLRSAALTYSRFSVRNAVRPVCKPVQAESEIASAEGRVKPLARLLRVCRA